MEKNETKTTTSTNKSKFQCLNHAALASKFFLSSSFFDYIFLVPLSPLVWKGGRERRGRKRGSEGPKKGRKSKNSTPIKKIHHYSSLPLEILPLHSHYCSSSPHFKKVMLNIFVDRNDFYLEKNNWFLNYKNGIIFYISFVTSFYIILFFRFFQCIC